MMNLMFRRKLKVIRMLMVEVWRRKISVADAVGSFEDFWIILFYFIFPFFLIFVGVEEKWWWGKWGSMKLGGRLGKELSLKWNLRRIQRPVRVLQWKFSIAVLSLSTRWLTRLSYFSVHVFFCSFWFPSLTRIPYFFFLFCVVFSIIVMSIGV